MRQILWFRRDLRVEDSALLANASGEVLPIFIFDKNILENLDIDDKRVSFIFNSVLNLKKELKLLGLDLKIFYGKPVEIFEKLRLESFDEVLCSIDFDSYAKKRDEEIGKIIPLKRYLDSFILNPNCHLKKDNTPYKVFTPFFKALYPLSESNHIEEFKTNTNIKLFDYDYDEYKSLFEMGFDEAVLPDFLYKNPKDILRDFLKTSASYSIDRDYFYKDSSSNMSVFLRFGLISPKQIFNITKKEAKEPEPYIRQLFWREFYNYILVHFPNSEFSNFNNAKVKWRNNKEEFEKWCDGKTGIPIIDASMQYLNETGLMHNRLRMVVSSYLTKNLLIDWKWGEEYFAKKLLDYEASSNIGSWQWAASTGADAVPYFRLFNPYLQSKKFDKEGVFIKSVLKELKDVDAKFFHKENGVQSNLFLDYPKQIISIEDSRNRAITAWKVSKDERD